VSRVAVGTLVAQRPPGKRGWGASGKLDLDLIRKIASASLSDRWIGGNLNKHLAEVLAFE
jgi:hypothetical protein